VVPPSLTDDCEGVGAFAVQTRHCCMLAPNATCTVSHGLDTSSPSSPLVLAAEQCTSFQMTSAPPVRSMPQHYQQLLVHQSVC